ncbi:substrate-binding domain-containing protein [Rhodospirillum rubrum]|uniref:Periplasmic binding protein/LacI transcriptional regulator n=1 Tax=Rhodospirillum rubrum (strain ATCC 11170 / ATH 1.1.1 / DSM 467 / LMG 4362 / NCIMB 8255 / S1) TaxID=269796 RepID=Q2RXU3_RHORT|nr:substrate-binding domain-containing protein [Rhodospirillum rubrum]ABC21052.1 Periplasmic binding protein/LacI transcriptional regulator [Rhodospirillum rubrum ATCC 11170]MBK5952596.1 LacI family transcriptional regulator [Rhodospirillum rubrum]QXG80748.1 substrate-binding domain-containing protein [Rhodospirillum rubrum]HAQ01037.1 LacI family transcriptional regulator [Rhodospirillum rubrum]HCF18573.1 LacI family transcriptional regulator [Rhodospirillum rubrum]
MKKLLLTACAAAALLSASAAMAADAPKARIAVLMYGNKAEFVQLMERYGKEHPAVKAGIAEVTFYDGRYDAAVQNDQAQMAINTKQDAIVVNPMDYEANIDIATNAKMAGIPVVVTNARLNTDEMTAEVVSDDVLGGYLEAKDVLTKLGCKGNVVIIEGPKGGSGEIQRGQGNEKALAECPAGAVKVLERKTANWSRAEALDLMQNWLSKHPGKINGVIGQNDEMALGAIEAIKAADLNVKDFAIAGIDGVTDALHAVKAGEMTSILQDARGQIQGSIDVALRAVKGPDYKPMSPIWEQYKADLAWADGQSKRYDIPWTVVTTANVDELLKDRN